MKPLIAHTGRMVPLPRNDVDTDQIIPSDFCRRLGRTGFEEGLFAGWRADPSFVLNDPARSGATVLVARANFGTGSSREPAVWALTGWGFRAVIAESFGDIFRRNALTNGLLAVALPREAVAVLRDRATADPEAGVTVDLASCRVRGADGDWPFEIPARARRLLMSGLDDIGLTLRRQPAIDAYEAGRLPWLPGRRPADIAAQR